MLATCGGSVADGKKCTGVPYPGPIFPPDALALHRPRNHLGHLEDEGLLLEPRAFVVKHPAGAVEQVCAGENGGRFTVKKYHSKLSTDLAVTTDSWRHRGIQLLPLNPAFEPDEIEAEVAADIVIVGEFLTIAPKI